MCSQTAAANIGRLREPKQVIYITETHMEIRHSVSCCCCCFLFFFFGFFCGGCQMSRWSFRVAYDTGLDLRCILSVPWCLTQSQCPLLPQMLKNMFWFVSCGKQVQDILLSVIIFSCSLMLNWMCLWWHYLSVSSLTFTHIFQTMHYMSLITCKSSFFDWCNWFMIPHWNNPLSCH